MSLNIHKNNSTGLAVSHYDSDNIYPILPLLSEEFPNWTINKIKNYVQLVITKKHDVAGMLVVRNESLYNVGLLIYTFQSMSSEYLYEKRKKNELIYVLVVENLISSSPILKQQVFLTIVESAIEVAKKNKCKYIELPRLDENYKLISKKYKKEIIKINSFRTLIELKV